MIRRILEFSVRQRAVVLLGTAALFGLGLWSAVRLPIDAVPDIPGVQVQVNTEIPALAAEESEKLVTQPIEAELAGLPGVEEMRSITKFGLSQVTLQFADGTDIYRARQLVTERLQGIADHMPAGTSSRLAPISTSLGEISTTASDTAPTRPTGRRTRWTGSWPSPSSRSTSSSPGSGPCPVSPRSTARAATNGSMSCSPVPTPSPRPG